MTENPCKNKTKGTCIVYTARVYVLIPLLYTVYLLSVPCSLALTSSRDTTNPSMHWELQFQDCWTAAARRPLVFILLLIILPHTTFLSLQLGCFFFFCFYIFHYYLVLSTESIIKTSTQSTPPGLYANLVHGVSTLDRLCYIEQHHQAAMFSRDATYTLTG